MARDRKAWTRGVRLEAGGDQNRLQGELSNAVFGAGLLGGLQGGARIPSMVLSS